MAERTRPGAVREAYGAPALLRTERTAQRAPRTRPQGEEKKTLAAHGDPAVGASPPHLADLFADRFYRPSRCQKTLSGNTLPVMALKFSPDSTCAEPAATEEHFHVWLDTGGLVLIAQAPRFRTRQAAVRRGIRPELLHVMKCPVPCRFTVKRQPRKPLLTLRGGGSLTKGVRGGTAPRQPLPGRKDIELRNHAALSAGAAIACLFSVILRTFGLAHTRVYIGAPRGALAQFPGGPTRTHGKPRGVQ